MKILQWLFPGSDKRKASIKYKQANVAAREQNDLINQSFDKEVAELSTYIEKEKEKDFIEDMEALIKDYGYTHQFAINLMTDFAVAEVKVTCPHCKKKHSIYKNLPIYRDEKQRPIQMV